MVEIVSRSLGRMVVCFFGKFPKPFIDLIDLMIFGVFFMHNELVSGYHKFVKSPPTVAC